MNIHGVRRHASEILAGMQLAGAQSLWRCGLLCVDLGKGDKIPGNEAQGRLRTVSAWRDYKKNIYPVLCVQ